MGQQSATMIPDKTDVYEKKKGSIHCSVFLVVHLTKKMYHRTEEYQATLMITAD